MEATYRWTGWVSAILFFFLAPFAPNIWTSLAFVLLGVSQLGHWIIDRAENHWNRKFETARYAEVSITLIAFPALVLIGLIVWAGDGFRKW